MKLYATYVIATSQRPDPQGRTQVYHAGQNWVLKAEDEETCREAAIILANQVFPAAQGWKIAGVGMTVVPYDLALEYVEQGPPEDEEVVQ